MTVLTALALASLVASPRAEDPKPESLDGEWRVVELVKDGTAEKKDKLAVTIKGDKFTVIGGTREEASTFTLDPKAKPAAIDLKPEKGNKGVESAKGIYKLEKDTLTICAGLDGGARPKEFKSEKGGGTVLFVLERVKK